MIHRKQLLGFILALSTSLCHAQNKRDLKIDYKLRGHIYAQSSIFDSTASGGYGGSSNISKPISDSSLFHQGEVCLFIDSTIRTDDTSRYNHMTLYIANLTDSVSSFEAQDSRLYAIPEAFINDRWQPIGYLPSSWCGNSYHSLYLKPGEQWEFLIPRFKGKTKTRMRYRLQLPMGDYVYSNEIVAHINRKQAGDKQGHTPKGLMDPYYD